MLSLVKVTVFQARNILPINQSADKKLNGCDFELTINFHRKLI